MFLKRQNESRIPNPESRIPNPESRIPNPESRIPNPKKQEGLTYIRQPLRIFSLDMTPTK
ncbi:hypothetical protein THZG08_650010 [Vibrio owensii]|nr:hypothetical protein THZG08_650010 [Vibrio owensii]